VLALPQPILLLPWTTIAGIALQGAKQIAEKRTSEISPSHYIINGGLP
jgi:hypothetical protein